MFSVPVHFDVKVTGAASVQITHANFYNLQSLDVTADPLNVGGTKILVSTTGYPIGALLEEFNLGDTGRDKIFQPHMPGESSVGPSFGEARFTSGGTMDILFLAASNASGGNYDYNVYSMSDITGGEIKQLTHLKGMTTELRVVPNASATFANNGRLYSLDLRTNVVKPI